MAEFKLQGSIFTTNGNILKVGSILPDFVLRDSDLAAHSLDDYKGKKILLSTNPSLDTAVCLKIAKDLNDTANKRDDIQVLFVSSDLPFASKRICTIESLENIHTLSLVGSDDFLKEMGLLITSGPLKGLVARSLFLTDENHKIIYAEFVEEITQEPHLTEALKLLDR